ncbi:MAG: hypothetical protein H6746_11900 [Deltaproteobacteria bacterium]|nr:hypothetical protein [Deltaproteobacteria bacterium]
MRPVAHAALAMLVASFVVAGCDSQRVGSAGDASGGDSHQGDTIPEDAWTCSPGEGSGVASDKPPCSDARLDLLTHPAGTPLLVPDPDATSSPAPLIVSKAVRVLTEDADLEIVGGLQGLHMVVLGFRTAALLQGELRVQTTLTADGVTLADRQWAKRALVDGRDGYGYATELYLIVDEADWKQWIDVPAELSLTVRTTAGLLVGDLTLPVVLRSP